MKKPPLTKHMATQPTKRVGGKKTARRRRSAQARTKVGIDYDQIPTVSRVVQLREVLLMSSHWRSLERAAYPQSAENTFSFELVGANWFHDPSPGNIEVDLFYEVAAFAQFQDDESNDDVPLFRLDFHWRVTYKVPKDFKPASADTMADFAVVNGQLNAFPYIRQFVQDVTGRGGFLPLILPVFQLPKRRTAPLGSERLATHPGLAPSASET